MKAITLNLVATAAVIITLPIISSCKQRDPQAEYEALSEAVYSDPQNGIDAAEEYIDHLYKKSGSRITEVYEIRDQYWMMKDLFSHYFSSYSEFLSMASNIDSELRGSNYPGVRETWDNLYKKERNRLLGPLMDSVTDLMFDGYFKNQIRQLCYNKFTTWDVESIDQISLDTPTIVRDGLAKECSGEYRVHLRGNIFGLRTGTARVSISGLIGVGYDGQLAFERTGYEFHDAPIF